MRSIFIRYVIVGALSAAIEMALLVWLVEKILLPPLTANLISFCVVNSGNYLLSRLWVFQRTGAKKRVEFFVFLFFVTCGLLINQMVFWVVTEKFSVDYRIAKILSISFIVGWNFFTRKFIVFSNRSDFSLSKEDRAR